MSSSNSGNMSSLGTVGSSDMAIREIASVGDSVPSRNSPVSESDGVSEVVVPGDPVI